MGVSKNSGTPKSSILIGFSIINHPFWGTPILMCSQGSLNEEDLMSYMQVVTCLSFLRSQVPKEDFFCGAKFLTKILGQ